MNLAILHYHLNRGGVTQVVQYQLQALATASGADGIERIAVLYGGRRDGWPDVPVTASANIEPELVVVPELEYDDIHGEKNGVSNQLAGELRLALNSLGMTPDNAVLHFHNHALGKNTAMPGAIVELAQAGYRILFQVHDFAEDFRPDNYRQIACAKCELGPYPQSSNIHYAVLNGRDMHILRTAGLDHDRLHMLPNPVAPFGELPNRADARRKLADRFGVRADQRYLLYPVRGIRRKNVGEMVLWAALLGDRAAPAITLRPRNPVEAVSYDRWAALARDLGLSCRFGVGDEGGLTFPVNLAAADAVLTTSVAEGFGMVFLEAWLAGKPLVGRDLPEITADFKTEGIQLPWLVDRIAIPLDRINRRTAHDALEHSYRTTCATYGHSPRGTAEFDRAFDRLTQDGTIDFAYLTGNLQAEFIRRLAAEKSLREYMLARNPAVAMAIENAMAVEVAATVAENRARIEERFGLRVIGERLLKLYQNVLASEVKSDLAPPPNADTILPSFLDPKRLHPIRLES